MAFLLDPATLAFPHPRLADEDGLLAVGADLSVERLLLAYQNGIFPWYDEDSPILWYAPKERFVISRADLRISKSMKQVMRGKKFRITHDQAFEAVIQACATIKRAGQSGTWILPEMQAAYLQLHQLGYAHSIEVWEGDALVGGLYGIQVGAVFCGESMFSTQANSSKLAFIHLVQLEGIALVDCQIHSEHLASIGAKLIAQEDFTSFIQNQHLQAYEFPRLL